MLVIGATVDAMRIGRPSTTAPPEHDTAPDPWFDAEGESFPPHAARSSEIDRNPTTTVRFWGNIMI
jgi:hypothetical protein